MKQPKLETQRCGHYWNFRCVREFRMCLKSEPKRKHSLSLSLSLSLPLSLPLCIPVFLFKSFFTLSFPYFEFGCERYHCIHCHFFSRAGACVFTLEFSPHFLHAKQTARTCEDTSKNGHLKDSSGLWRSCWKKHENLGLSTTLNQRAQQHASRTMSTNCSFSSLSLVITKP